MTASKTLFYFSLSFILGIFLASVIMIPKILIFGIFVLGAGIIASHFLFKKDVLLIIGFCVLVLVLGMMRLQISQSEIQNNELKKLNDVSKNIALIGVVSAEPDIRQISEKLTVTTQKVIVDNKEYKANGKVLVGVRNYGKDAGYQYLDLLKITGKLKTPAVFEDFNYKEYLQKDGIYSVIDYPKIEIISKGHQYNLLTFLYEKILWLKSKLMLSITSVLSPPHSFILEGMVFGNDNNMSQELKDKFNTTGLSHVTAVSGTNIVIIISLVVAILLALGFWRGQAFYLAAMFIFIYIILIGFPISGIRAAIMGCIALLAQKLGRQNTSSRVLVLTGALVLFENPLLLVYDVSFQLSFLASLGIIYIKPLMDIGLQTLTKDHAGTLVDLISITLSAQIITLPIILYNFGRISLIAPISNLLALPVVEALTILGFFLAIVGAIVPALSFVFALPCWLLLSYFIKVLDFFSQPWAIKSIEYIPWYLVLVFYIALIFAVKYLQKFLKPKFLGF